MGYGMGRVEVKNDGKDWAVNNPFAPIWKEIKSKKMKDKIVCIREFPLVVDVELTNVCNFECRMCPTWKHSTKRKKGYMSSETFAAVLSECAQYGAAIRFVRWGEPLLHPQLLGYIRAAKASGLLTHINTNGSLIDPNFVSEIVKIPLDSLKLSFQGVRADEYKFWRGVDNFEFLLATAGEIRRIRKNRQKPYIIIGTTITKASPDEIAHFKLEARKIADEVTVGKTRKIGKEVGCNPECPEVFDKISVNWDGTVSACCSDYDNKMIVGNIKEQKLKKIWDFSDDLWEYRTLLAEGKHSELEMCKQCCL